MNQATRTAEPVHQTLKPATSICPPTDVPVISLNGAIAYPVTHWTVRRPEAPATEAKASPGLWQRLTRWLSPAGGE